MLAWVHAGSTLAETFEGFLGAGWLRPPPGRREWHMLYRFGDAEALQRWERSAQRSWWLASAQGIVEHTRVERRTGIEGWFEAPAAATVEVAPRVPPRRKQMVVIWLGFFPLSLLASVTLGRVLADVNVVLRTFLTTVCLIPVMTYLVLPRVTRALERWLQGRPAPWRAARRGPRAPG
ncbi:antibiotic biosynthesis monooxygenase [Kineococcus xinjiangensis]